MIETIMIIGGALGTAIILLVIALLFYNLGN
jgi:hypothetical protein